MSDFFGYKNHACPPLLAKFESMLSSAKSDLAKCLEELSSSYQSDPPLIKVVILDGAAIVNMLKAGHFKTFQKYGEEAVSELCATVAETSCQQDRHRLGCL